MTNIEASSPQPDVSAVVTFHREGPLAYSTLLSIERCRRYAENAGMSVEFVITLDNADAETVRIVSDHAVLRDCDQIHQVSYGDLSTCRNHAVAFARGHYVGTFDGDDYFSANWIERGVQMVRAEGEDRVFHPEIIVAFGAQNVFWRQVDQTSEFFRPGALLTTNYWNACVFAARSVFELCPYSPSRVGETGFGFEDWHWNCETIARGYIHRLAPGTARFERRKLKGSLNVAHQQVDAVIRPSLFFDQL